MMFRLAERPIDELPIHIERSVDLDAPADEVFDVLADLHGWPNWFKGMRRVRSDGAASGVGARRTVWVPPTRVEEWFSRWDPGERLTFHIVASSAPGLRAMTEDWRLEPLADGRTRLVIDIGVEPSRWLRPLSPVVRRLVATATRGATGIQARFPSPG
jgi:uncharacterized membrane protein